MKKTTMILLVLCLAATAVYAENIYGGETLTYNFSYCDYLTVNITPCESGEWTAQDCTEETTCNFFCNCTDNYKLYLTAAVNAVGTYNITMMNYSCPDVIVECNDDQDCSQTNSMCDYENKTYCTRDSYGYCDPICGCIYDEWECSSEDYCSNCNHCGDGIVNCGEDCELGEVGRRCLPEGTSAYYCLNNILYETPTFDSCKDSCVWDNCQTKTVIENDPRCFVSLPRPTCNGCTFTISNPFSFTRPTISFPTPMFSQPRQPSIVSPMNNVPGPVFINPIINLPSMSRR